MASGRLARQTASGQVYALGWRLEARSKTGKAGEQPPEVRPGIGDVSPARSRRRAARGLPRPVTNSIEASVEGDMGDKDFSPSRTPSKSLRHIHPKFSRIRNTLILWMSRATRQATAPCPSIGWEAWRDFIRESFANRKPIFIIKTLTTGL